MRSGQQKQRGRGRNNGGGGGGGGNNNGNNNRKGGNPLSRSYDSTGPDVKIRGTAQHIAEKYSTLARDAQSVGDNVMAENYFQHAEHYNRIIAAAQAQMQERFQRNERDFGGDGNSDRDDDDDQPQMGGYRENDQDDRQPQAQPQPQQNRENREGREQRDNREGRDNRDNREGREVREGQDGREGRQSAAQRQERSDRDRNPRRERGDGQQNGDARRERRETAVAQSEDAIRPTDDTPRTPVETAVAGTGPQPEIEGTPAEVSIDDESAEGAAPKRAPRRRVAAARPKRVRAKADDSGDAPEAGVTEPVAVPGE